MAAAAMKHMASNFAKLDKFEGVDFRRWQKKMHFLLSSMSVVYMLTIPMPNDGGDNPTVEQVKKRAKWGPMSLCCRRAVVRLPNPKLKTLGERGIECIFVRYVEHSKAFRFYILDQVQDSNTGTRRHRFDDSNESKDVAFWKEELMMRWSALMWQQTHVVLVSVSLPPGCKPLGCKWINKRKLKMDVKTTFLNGELDEDVYMNQLSDIHLASNLVPLLYLPLCKPDI
ncbi:hypothetical protein Tco_0876138 [Tanacetum coccineum]|uniref:Retroviral polymerase SH3-like domain-containing protein n=1 Tax=Tanacetum coccineum TaxID=301880 RepID=A0ABQ5BU77_9ASTR